MVACERRVTGGGQWNTDLLEFPTERFWQLQFTLLPHDGQVQ